MHLDATISAGCPGTRISPGPLLELDAIAPAAWPEAAVRFLDQHVKYFKQPSGLLVPKDRAGSPEVAALFRAINEHYARCKVNQATLELFAKRWGRHFCHTLRRAPAWASSLDSPLKGRPAFVVGAGPSLDRNGHLLAEAQKRGPIIAVNTAISACLHHGVVPDLVVAAEALDLAHHLAPLQGLNVPVVLDSFIHPANWGAAPNAWALGKSEPNIIPYVTRCGAVPLPYTGGVSCAAVSLALYWGAAPVVLIGQDLAYTGGRFYAEGTPFADLRAEVVGPMVVVTGKSKAQAPCSAVWRPAWGGGQPVVSDHGMGVLLDWFAAAADRHYVINATEGGAHIEHCYEQPLERVLAMMAVQPPLKLPEPERVSTARVQDDLRRWADKVIADPTIDSVPIDFPVLNLWTTTLAFDGERDPRQRVRMRREAMVEGAREILEVLG